MITFGWAAQGRLLNNGRPLHDFHAAGADSHEQHDEQLRHVVGNQHLQVLLEDF